MKMIIQLIKYLVLSSIILLFFFLSLNERRKQLEMHETITTLMQAMNTFSDPEKLAKITEEYKMRIDKLDKQIVKKDSIITSLSK